MHINADVGEDAMQIADGRQEALLAFVTQVNIACGGHAGDEQTMRVSIEQARRYGLQIGAHPGYEDRANFGRVELALPHDEVEQLVWRQVRRLGELTDELQHVKPHGALYNQAARDPELARAIAQGVGRYSRALTLVGLAGSRMLEAFADAGFQVAAEAFADRRYNADGTLVSRTRPDALLEDPGEAATQALRMAAAGGVDTICVHGDTPGAAAIARAVARVFIR